MQLQIVRYSYIVCAKYSTKLQNLLPPAPPFKAFWIGF